MPKSPRFSPNPTRAIEVLTFPAVQLLDVTGPVQVFSSANDLVAGAGGAAPYRLRLVTQGGEGVTSSAGVALTAGRLGRRGEALDTLLVAGGQGRKRPLQTRCWSIGCGNGRHRRAVSPPSALAHSCLPPRACWTAVAR